VTTVTGPAGYVEWEAPAGLRRYVACTWTGGLDRARREGAEPVLPDGCIDVIWDGRRAFVAGPDTGPVEADAGPAFHVGLRFRPGMAPLFLGVPADELLDRDVDLDAFWADAGRLAGELDGAASLREAAAVLEAGVTARLAAAGAADPLVEAATSRWAAGVTGGGTAALAGEAGISERQLHRRFVRAVGYGPKLFQRVVRFQAFLDLSACPSPGLGALAAGLGYADQAHLCRETQALSGLTPARLRADRQASDSSKTPAAPVG
jgi:AraC-like DNA-binding protein